MKCTKCNKETYGGGNYCSFCGEKTQHGKQEFFKVLRLHRDDIRDEFEGELSEEQIDKITDRDMEIISARMAETLMQSYWIALRDALQRFHLNK